MVVALPRIEWAEYLVGYLFEFGPGPSDGGAWEVGHVNDVERGLKVVFKPWETRLLVRLSREYIGASQEASKSAMPCPWPEAAWQWRRAQNWQMERNLDAFCK